MARRSLKPQLNQIRAWVRQGRTDAWIAHQLEISASELREFRKQHGLTADEEDSGAGDVDLRDEIEAEVEAATAEEAAAGADETEEEEPAEEEPAEEEPPEEEPPEEEPPEEEPAEEEKPARKRGGGARKTRAKEKAPAKAREKAPAKAREKAPAKDGDKGPEPEAPREGGEGGRRRRRRRGRRGGRGRRRELEATFDHGETDGYGLWLDPSVRDNPVYAEHWAGKREVTVRIEADQIVIRRAGESGSGSNG